MNKKDALKGKFSTEKASDESAPVARTFGGKNEQPKPKSVEETQKKVPGRGPGKAERRIIYFFKRDLKLLKDVQKELKNEHGKVTLSELIRWAINTINFKDFHRGY